MSNGKNILDETKEVEELKKKLDSSLVHIVAWEKDDFRPGYVWLDGYECGIVAFEVIVSPYEGVEVQGAVRFFMQDKFGKWEMENGGRKKEWKMGKVKWEYIK